LPAEFKKYLTEGEKPVIRADRKMPACRSDARMGFTTDNLSDAMQIRIYSSI
jgi:hypothetical protein